MGLDELEVTVDFYKVALHVHCFQLHLAFVKGGGPESLKKNSKILDKDLKQAQLLVWRIELGSFQ